MPVVWAILLSGAIAGFESFALPIQFLRLVLVLCAGICGYPDRFDLHPLGVLEPGFRMVAWTAAALNAVGVLDIVIEWLRATGFSVGDVSISAWTIVKGIVLAGLAHLGEPTHYRVR